MIKSFLASAAKFSNRAQGKAALALLKLTMAMMAVAVIVSMIGTNGAKAAQTTCGLGSEFSLLKNRDNDQASSTSSWQVLYRGVLVYEISGNELNAIYGGYSSGHGGAPPIDCGNIVVGADFFAFRMGWQSDLLMAFGIEKGSDVPHGVRILRYYPHDYGMALSTSNNELLAVYGWKHDLQARFCWNPQNDGHWWHNADHRAGMGACVSNTWPWEYPVSGEQEVQFE
jgi:hypothetical protein